MIFSYLITVSIIFGLLALWIAVQIAARRFAARHPELGPAREEGGGCGGLFCLCQNAKSCPKRKGQTAREDISKSTTHPFTS